VLDKLNAEALLGVGFARAASVAQTVVSGYRNRPRWEGGKENFISHKTPPQAQCSPVSHDPTLTNLLGSIAFCLMLGQTAF